MYTRISIISSSRISIIHKSQTREGKCESNDSSYMLWKLSMLWQLLYVDFGRKYL